MSVEWFYFGESLVVTVRWRLPFDVDFLLLIAVEVDFFGFVEEGFAEMVGGFEVEG